MKTNHITIKIPYNLIEGYSGLNHVFDELKFNGLTKILSDTVNNIHNVQNINKILGAETVDENLLIERLLSKCSDELQQIIDNMLPDLKEGENDETA